jgi:hypothetical protein
MINDKKNNREPDWAGLYFKAYIIGLLIFLLFF